MSVTRWSGIDWLLERARKAGTVRDDLRPAELNALLAALCQEALTEVWSESFRRRTLTALMHFRVAEHLALAFVGVRGESHWLKTPGASGPCH